MWDIVWTALHPHVSAKIKSRFNHLLSKIILVSKQLNIAQPNLSTDINPSYHFIHNFISPPGPWFNKKMSSYWYRESHCGDKTVVRSSYLHNGISYTGKKLSLYWIGAQTPAKLPRIFPGAPGNIQGNLTGLPPLSPTHHVKSTMGVILI